MNEEMIPAATTPRTKNTLTLPQQLKLADWCRAAREDCSIKTYADLADIAAATLKFPVTPANMSSIIEACEIERKKAEAPATLDQQVVELRGLLTLQQAVMIAMGAQVEKLNLHCFGELPVKDHPELPLVSADCIDPADCDAALRAQ